MPLWVTDVVGGNLECESNNGRNLHTSTVSSKLALAPLFTRSRASAMGCMGLRAAAAAAWAWLGDDLRFLLFLDLEDAARSAWQGMLAVLHMVNKRGRWCMCVCVLGGGLRLQRMACKIVLPHMPQPDTVGCGSRLWCLRPLIEALLSATTHGHDRSYAISGRREAAFISVLSTGGHGCSPPSDKDCRCCCSWNKT